MPESMNYVLLYMVIGFVIDKTIKIKLIFNLSFSNLSWKGKPFKWTYDFPLQIRYKNKGLPPGPICNPPAAAIDAVLNPEEHEYIYFCAQPGNTGYHSFAINLQEHNKNASLFHKYLNLVFVWSILYK